MFICSHMKSGGAERTIAYLSNWLSKNNDVTICSYENDIFYHIENSVMIKTSSFVSSTNTCILNRLINYIRIKAFVSKTISGFKPDVVISLLTSNVRHLPRRRNFALITSERSNPNYCFNKKEIFRKRHAFEISDGIVFQTKRVQDVYSSFYNKSIVIENAIGNEYVYKYKASENKEPVIAAIGRLHPAKDYVTLIKAFEIVHQSFPNYCLVIYGDGQEKEKLVTLLTELDLKSFVKFYLPCTDAIYKIKDATCYCLSSKYEGMPNALMEAMAMGIPCVSTDCQYGPAELITNNYNGLLVPVGDYRQMATAIIDLIKNHALASKISTNGKKILETHSVERIAQIYYEYMRSVFEKWRDNL